MDGPAPRYIVFDDAPQIKGLGCTADALAAALRGPCFPFLLHRGDDFAFQNPRNGTRIASRPVEPREGLVSRSLSHNCVVPRNNGTQRWERYCWGKA
jgi:hypothetical protein